MASNSGKIDFVTAPILLRVPSCQHGPALLFTKYDNKSTTGRQFFACAAFRDKKVCPFFQWAEDFYNNRKTESHPSSSDKYLRKRFKQFLSIKKEDRTLCIDCGLLLLESERERHENQSHKLHKGISRSDLLKPTLLFRPLDSNKTYAQYMFTDKTVEFIVSSLKRLSATHVLSIGCPRIHEYILTEEKETLTSLLLDLDHRYMQFYSPEEMLRYNMMNHHFFGGEDERAIFEKFMEEAEDKKVAIVVDPPFGIMVEALAVTLAKIRNERTMINTGSDSALQVLWIFPYFMEKRVIENCQDFTMLDYKVDYKNHSLFKKDHGRKKGSPVRIFTNIEAKDFPLPTEEGYWFCSRCNRYCSAENKHCLSCNSCTTKDGSTYKHCDKCSRCVKPSRIHCDTCGQCDLPDHICGQSQSTGCHICGEIGHKRRECPNKAEAKDPLVRGKKRKANLTLKRRKKQKT